MKITTKITDKIVGKIPIFLPIIAILSTTAAFAGQGEIDAKSTASPPPVEKKEANPLCFLDGKLCFDIQERLRFEGRNNNFDFNSDVDSLTDDSWLLNRFRIGVAITPVDWLKSYAQGKTHGSGFQIGRTLPACKEPKAMTISICAKPTFS